MASAPVILPTHEWIPKLKIRTLKINDPRISFSDIVSATHNVYIAVVSPLPSPVQLSVNSVLRTVQYKRPTSDRPNVPIGIWATV
jgi:hypothetical protein